ncbi:phosphoribosylanthranilate isomerase [Echinicola shivajiensis]|uniref:phosphoribosylanthranilate isomerase n=1 Tax=Echinicola shivajiensis TaxID=1035916 RepID=UPI001BFC1C07|nr:phosphoribosylanthranilate isomerase [Echinicola shivajiensis]
MLVKVCGMREPSNVLELLDKVSPDLMGMIFFPKSSRYVGLSIPELEVADVVKVGVFVNRPQGEIKEIVDQFNLSYVQLHGDEGLEYVKELKGITSAEIIKVFRVEESIDWDELKALEPFVKYFLFDTQTKQYGGSGKKFDWSILEDYPLQKPFLLSGGIDEDNVDKIKELAQKVPQLAGVDINSKFEIEAALKDVDKIKTFVEALRSK